MSVIRALAAARRAGRAAAAARRPWTSNPYAGRREPASRILARAWRVGYGEANPFRRRDIPREDLD